MKMPIDLASDLASAFVLARASALQAPRGTDEPDACGALPTAGQGAGVGSREVTVTRLAGVECLAGEAEDWRRLAVSCSISLDLDWLSAWVASYAEGRQFVLLKAVQGGRAVGYLPVLIGPERWCRLPVLALTFCVNDHSAWSSLVVDQGIPQQVAEAFEGHILAWEDWHIFRMARVPLMEPGTFHFLEGMLSSGSCFLTRLQYQTAVRMPDTWDAYLSGLSRNFRRNLRRTERELAKAGTVGIAIEDDANELGSAFSDLLAIEARSWKETGGETMSSKPNILAYYDALVLSLGRRGACWIATLSVDGRPVSAALFFEHGGYCYGLKTSSDQSFESGQSGPGHLTILAGMREGHRRGLRTVQFLTGAPAFQKYAGHLDPVVSAIAFNRGAYSRLVRLLDRCVEGAGLRRRPAGSGHTMPNSALPGTCRT